MVTRHDWTDAEREEIAAKTDGTCKDCGATDQLEIEHELPLWLGGEDAVENAVLRCQACHKPKTKREAKARAKVKRLERQRRGLSKKSKLTKMLDGSVRDTRTGGLPWETRDGFTPIKFR